MKISRLFTVCALALVLLGAIFGQVLAADTVEKDNLFLNPTFAGAEDTIPPAGWALYQQLDENRRMSVIDADDPAQRALLVEDLLGENSVAGEIGLQQTVTAGPGTYRVTMQARGIEGVTGRVNLQLRFLPSNLNKVLTIETGDISKTAFETFVVEDIAPEGTTAVRVYLLTWKLDTPALAIRSISLFKLDTSPAGNRVENPTTLADNLFLNPTFAGAEDTVPPPNWSLYGQLDANRRMSVIDANNPTKRALLVEDLLAENSAAGEIGLQQTVAAGPGTYRITMRARGIEGISGRVNLQLRFLPSNQNKVLTIETGDISKTAFADFVVEGVAPEGTTGVRVYLLTWKQDMPKIAVQSISLVKVE